MKRARLTPSYPNTPRSPAPPTEKKMYISGFGRLFIFFFFAALSSEYMVRARLSLSLFLSHFFFFLLGRATNTKPKQKKKKKKKNDKRAPTRLCETMLGNGRALCMATRRRGPPCLA